MLPEAPEKYRVGLVQMSATGDPEHNLQHAVEWVRKAAAQGAQIVCLPELFQTQYFCQREDAALFDLAESIPGPTTAKLSDLAKQLNIVLVASLFEKRTPRRLSQHCGDVRHGRHAARPVPQDAHPGRSRFTTKSSTSRLAISASRPSTPTLDASARWSAGTSGTRKARG